MGTVPAHQQAHSFGCCLAGRLLLQEAYAAMLSNTVAEVQLDCMQRLVHSLCNAGRVQLLCALPFSANLLVSLSGSL